MSVAPLIGLPADTMESDGRIKNGVSATYVRAVAGAGGLPVSVPFLLDVEQLRALYERLDGLLLCGGGDVDPSHYGAEDRGLCSYLDAPRDVLELRLTRWALAENKPLLAICRGTQILNVAAGGSLVQDIASEVPDTLSHSWEDGRPRDVVHHSVTVQGDSLLAEALALDGAGGQVGVNSMHHQAIARVGEGLHVVARAEDGIVEAIEADHSGSFLLGVQWHPEELVDDHRSMRQLFAHFVQACRMEMCG